MSLHRSRHPFRLGSEHHQYSWVLKRLTICEPMETNEDLTLADVIRAHRTCTIRRQITSSTFNAFRACLSSAVNICFLLISDVIITGGCLKRQNVIKAAIFKEWLTLTNVGLASSTHTVRCNATDFRVDTFRACYSSTVHIRFVSILSIINASRN